MIKTPLTELIERLEEKIKICSSNNLEREAMGMIEAKAIATELLETEREQIEEAYIRSAEQLSWKPEADEEAMSEQYYNETFNQNK